MNFVTVTFKVGVKNPRGFLFEITLQLKFEAKNPRCILQFLGTCSGRIKVIHFQKYGLECKLRQLQFVQ